ncbi:MAG: ATP-binding protein [Thermoflexaceae bacterium]|nr:ATP-binding protein [Thermoflexaceae bacterium]
MFVQASEDLYEIIQERYERRPLIVTSSRPARWPRIFSDSLLASAALDRLTHHCQTILIQGQSYRQSGRRKEGTVIEQPANTV